VSGIFYPGIAASELSEEQKANISAVSSLAAGLAGGIIGDSSMAGVQAAAAGKTAVENNYLSSTDKSRQTYLNHKENLTEQEKQERDALNRKDLETDLAVMQACHGGEGDCQTERAKAKEALDTYINLSYQNPKEAQAGYQQIQALLNSTDPNAKDVFNVLEGYTQAFMRFGYTEEEAKARAGVYVGSVYIAGGISAVVASGALAKQFGEDIAQVEKPSDVSKTESMAANAGKGSANTAKNTPETQASVDKKLATYLLEKEHPVGGSKAEWFDSALGFNKENSSELAKQIVFDPKAAIKTSDTQFGTKYDQVIPITGTNGRTINVKFGWIENNDGIVRLVTAIPAKK